MSIRIGRGLRLRAQIFSGLVALLSALHCGASTNSPGTAESESSKYKLTLTANPDVSTVCLGSSVTFTATLTCKDPAGPAADKEVKITVNCGNGSDGSGAGSANATVCGDQAGANKLQVTATGGDCSPVTKAIDVVLLDSIGVLAPTMCSVNKTGVSITATATCCGSPACGVAVTFASSDLTFPSGSTAVTDSNGVATISADAGSTPSSCLDGSSVTASADNGLGTPVTDDDDFTIVRVNNPTPANPKIIDGHLTDSIYKVVLTYTVSPAISGVPVQFAFETGDGEGDLIPASLLDASSSTNGSGQTTVTVQSSDLRETATVKGTYQESSGSTGVTFQGINGAD